MKKDIYIFNDGDLKRKDNTIYFIGENRSKYIPVEQIDNIWVFGEINLNKKLLNFISQKQICIHFFNYYGYYIGTFYPREHLNSGYVILKQAENYLDYGKRLDIARKIIKTAIMNMIVILKYYKGRGLELDIELDDINNKMNQMDDVRTIEELMALEGNIRETYYGCFSKIIRNEDFKFTVRNKRPPLDKINALISFGNSLMYVSVLSEIYETHLDPRIGYLHSTNMRRFTLNLDVAEIFKPIIVDRIIFSLLNRNVITSKDFSDELNGIILTDEGKMKFLKEYNDKLNSTMKYPGLNQYVTYKRLIRMELYKIQKHLMGDKEYKGFVMRW